MRIRKLILRNFKRFEKLELPLGPFNLLVGPNNSGKSTLLQACALFDHCYRTCLEKINGQLQFVNKTVGVEEYGIIPTAHPLDLWTNRIARKGSKELVPIHLECEFSDGTHLAFEIKIIYNWQRKLFRKALQLWLGKKTVVLTVIFFSDGCVTFFNGEMDGRVCP
jgi:hypothetical protein